MSSTMDRLAIARAARSQAQDVDVEMATRVTTPNAVVAVDSPNGITTSPTQPAFLSEVVSIQADIQRINALVDQIAVTHSQILTSIETHTGKDPRETLDEQTQETRKLIQHAKDRIDYLRGLPFHQNASVKRNQISLLGNKLLETVQNLQRVEFDADVRSKQALERKLRLIKPSATSEEIDSYINDTGGGQQVFTQALMTSTNYDQARLAHREAEQRQHDIRRMEDTLRYLTQLMSDMAVLVNQQDDIVQEIDKQAQEVHDNTKKAHDHTVEGVKYARSYRKKRWICFGLLLLICAILALVLGLALGLRK